ncbi:ABC transporter permease [Mucilaginibacter sp. UYCu711]|uniref:ABC transporter permease n=1 Tax=Mucilaginibacter sp. UYCu711 TaxID=3156339 RepID=UPI003D2393FB
MIRNYFKIAWRNLLQNKVTSFISIAGLAVGIGCFLLLTTYLLNEVRYDRFNTNADRIVRVIQGSRSSTDNADNIIAVTPTAPVPVFKQQFQEVADGVRIYNYTGYKPATVQYKDKLFNERKMLVADNSFFKIFSYKFILGTAANSLNLPESAVITATIAKKYFGDENPIGKILQVNTTRNLVITGVIEDVPAYSHLKFDIMGNYAMLDRSKDLKWDSANDYSYLLLKSGVNAKSLEKSINAYTSALNKDNDRSGYKSWFVLEPLTQVHLYTTAKDNLEPSGNVKYIYILGAIAVILLVLACINFLNLVTAKSIERAHEIGVRKVMGALRWQLFSQFIGEAAFITFLSLIAGVLMAWASFSWFSNFSGNELNFAIWKASWLLGALVGLFVIVTLLAGTYPALYLSAFKPVATLKGKSTGSSGGAVLRKSLVVFQFSVSVFFIISTLIAGRQLQYIQQLDTGINRDQVVVLDIGGMPFDKVKAFKDQVMQQQGIKNVSASYDSPVNVRGGYTINEAQGIPGKMHISITAIPVERNFVNTLGIKLIAGTNFTLGDEQSILDTNRGNRKYSFVINESTAKAIGWTPEQAIGKRINMAHRIGEIRGVARDFNFASLHHEVTPIVLFPEYDYFGKLLIKTSGVNMAGTVAGIKKTWKSFYPNVPFENHFLDQEYEELYLTEQRTGGILTVFTLVTVFISCLGLFGLAVFSTRQRVREVGIRKILGSSVLNIVGLISKDFLKLVLLSIIIASPFAYYVMHKWLQGFVYRANIQWWIFALAAGLAIVIAFLTISYQAIKAALANPVKSLKNE